MASVPENLTPLLSALDENTLILTPNHLTSVQLLEWVGQYRQATGQGVVCSSPNIFPIDIWIRRQCMALLDSGSTLLPASTLLDPSHEGLVWNEIIRQTETGATLLNISATAKAVQDTWTLVHLWCITRKELDDQAGFRSGNSHDDLQAYLEWTDAFETFCRKQRLATLVEMLEQFIPLIKEEAISLPQRILHCGFNNPPPLYQQLLGSLGGNAADREVAMPAYAPDTTLLGYADAREELEAAALWARETADTNPEASIGIIIPDLYQRRAVVQRVFSRRLVPEESRTLQTVSAYPYALSAGRALSQFPVVTAALRFLGRNRFNPETLDSCLFLRSPYMAGSDSEAHARASLEKILRDNNMPYTSNADLKRLSGMTERAFHAPLLSACLTGFDEVARPASGRSRPTREWADIFEAQLAALGWPGERELSDEEQSVLKSWHQLLAEYCQLSTVFGALNPESALGLLTRIADNTTIRPRTTQARIQVLTPTEADGLQFTHCRMLGLSEQQWPPAPRPSPFLPYALQKQKGIPDADIRTHADDMRKVLERITANTHDEMIFSYPSNDGDIALKPSLMLKQLADVDSVEIREKTYLPLHPLAAAFVENNASRALEIHHESSTLPLLAADSIKGGTSLIADQAECPFRSFVSHRLKAKPLEKLVTGLTPRAAGSLVHLVLELFWKQIASQADLLAMDNAPKDSLVNAVIADAIRETRKKHFYTMTESFCELEGERLRDLLLQWLEVESKRGSFRVIAQEFSTSWQHPGINLELRIDRIDQDDEGRLVLVDYKTARNTSVDWEDERPITPQLMLYCLSAEQARVRQEALAGTGPVTALFFAQVNIENSRYTGLSENSGTYPGVSVQELNGKWHGLSETATWESLREHWEKSLGMLAEEFLNGCVSITPRKNNSCDHCFARPVCRIDEVIEP